MCLSCYNTMHDLPKAHEKCISRQDLIVHGKVKIILIASGHSLLRSLYCVKITM